MLMEKARKRLHPKDIECLEWYWTTYPCTAAASARLTGEEIDAGLDMDLINATARVLHTYPLSAH